MNYDFTFAVASLLLIVTLFFSSREDWKYHRISKKYVLIVLLTVMVYNNVAGSTIEATVCFLLTLGIFSAITFASRGGFGFGDTMILGALGWFIGNLKHLQYYFLILVFYMLLLGGYFVTINYKQNHKGWKLFFNNKIFVPVEKLKPGMILCDDYFMKGLTENEIKEWQRKSNGDTLCIKQAYPFIPVIFVSFLIYVAVVLADIL
jgi:Flp pilus assembly protein protease CpaA